MRRHPAISSWRLTYPPVSQKGGKPSSSSAQAPSSSSSRYENKPPPPRPVEHRNSDRHQTGGHERASPRPQPGPGPVDRYGGMSPPPTSSTRPNHHTLPPASSRPPPSPALHDNGADPTLLPLFRAVDKDGKTDTQLCRATRSEIPLTASFPI